MSNVWGHQTVTSLSWSEVSDGVLMAKVGICYLELYRLMVHALWCVPLPSIFHRLEAGVGDLLLELSYFKIIKFYLLLFLLVFNPKYAVLMADFFYAFVELGALRLIHLLMIFILFLEALDILT